MFNKKNLILILIICIPLQLNAAKTSSPKTMGVDLQERGVVTKRVTSLLAQDNLSDIEVKAIQKNILNLSGKAVPGLIEVMKTDKYPDKNRWIATFLLGQIMGEKSSPFIAKFTEHPSWVMRTASLKTLLALKEERFAHKYTKALKDESLLVRSQALENIRILNLKSEAPYVWQMLYDKRNYYESKAKGEGKSHHKRSHLIKDVIKTVGDLEFSKAKEPLFKMVQNDRYKDIFEEIDYALSKIVKKKSPEGHVGLKRHFWRRTAMSYTEF